MNIITKFSFATKGGISAHNPYKVNQDSFILHPNFNKSPYCHLFSVCDGHGLAGRDASDFIKQHLPRILESEAQKAFESGVDGDVLQPEDALAFVNFIERTEHAFAPQFSKAIYERIYTEGFEQCNRDLNE